MTRQFLSIARSALFAAITVGAVGTAAAKECNGVTFPDQTEVAGSPLILNGLGLRKATVLKVKVYVAALYVASTSTTADAILAADRPKQLVLHFVRDVDADDLQKAWQEGFEKNAGGQMGALAPPDREAQRMDDGCEERPEAHLHVQTWRGG